MGDGMDNIMVGNRIRMKREGLHMTRELFAERIGVTPKFCSDIELGIKGFSIKTLIRIAQVFGVTTDYILFGDAYNERVKNITKLAALAPTDKLSYIEDILKQLVKSYEDRD